ncbi:MAG: sigma-70 family RNA polymerase sigma factor [Cephaloticoccus sp.]|nr:sigma-70 family RNA polymerase sigma factor [Cephaloticoccus sp.]MCF7760364.1 sigma-70 family RNA polymerase sigma factor [Cephaloticoccus sp.]
MVSVKSNDEELVAHISQHDEKALQELLHRYQDRLCKYSLSLIGRRDLAEEAVANVFLNIWRRREELIIKSSVRRYLYSAVGNQAINLSKSQQATGTVQLDNVSPAELADVQSSDTRILYQEFREEIENLLMGLPEKRRLIFRMNRLEGLSYGTIAAKLGLSVFTIQNHMVQAKKQLADKLPLFLSSLAS